ncbi:hypothetical protein EZJ19_08800 [Parasulfuritortus cantonensis]|uniref:Uncharacterized protein n=1 Tax=Parasulfuritortus cantonensis TaxID=2528202 RepID=A0A4R1BDA9_9PROT|nr:hypothetical protein [Parasulfuritortus cantonensis]TCJ14968.1 hypothetical protein EZJ19_08800 [Parasulfuritortus cantonensis]
MTGAIRLAGAAEAWGTADFKAVLKREVEGLDPARLPLQQGLSTCSHALDEPVTALVIGAAEVGGRIQARVGVFYSGIIAGCSCADDPTPFEPQNEYCEMLFEIDPASGAAVIALADD